jgi:small subunit ribosomal protein S16
MRLGKMREPHYRIVVADARTKRDGRAIETIGEYHPKSDPSIIRVDGERAAYWLGVGAQPTEAVAAILRVTGDWQKFAGEPAPPAMLVPAGKPDKHALFAAALAEVSGEPEGEATTPRKRAAKKAAPVVDAPVVDAPVVDAPVVDAPVVDAPVVDAPVVAEAAEAAEAVAPAVADAAAAEPES